MLLSDGKLTLEAEHRIVRQMLPQNGPKLTIQTPCYVIVFPGLWKADKIFEICVSVVSEKYVWKALKI